MIFYGYLPTLQQFHTSTIQQFNSSTIQQFNISTVQHFLIPTLPQFLLLIAFCTLNFIIFALQQPDNHNNIKHLILNNLFEGLNSEQQKAVAKINGAMMVIAGAGSGKTRVLTYRIAYMISQGINPFDILSLTFTNKAAEEMKERIISLLGNSTGRNVWMGTFHSIFSRILHIESEYIGFTKNFSVYNQDDSKNLIKTIIKEKNLDDKQYRPGTVQAMISNAKANLISPEEYSTNSLIAADNQTKKLDMLGSI